MNKALLTLLIGLLLINIAYSSTIEVIATDTSWSSASRNAGSYSGEVLQAYKGDVNLISVNKATGCDATYAYVINKATNATVASAAFIGGTATFSGSGVLLTNGTYYFVGVANPLISWASRYKSETAHNITGTYVIFIQRALLNPQPTGWEYYGDLYHHDVTNITVELYTLPAVTSYNITLITDNSTNPNHIYSFNESFRMNFCLYDNASQRQPEQAAINITGMNIINRNMTVYSTGNFTNCSYIDLIHNGTYNQYEFNFTVWVWNKTSVNLTDKLISIHEPTFIYWIYRDVQEIKTNINNFFAPVNEFVQHIRCLTGLTNLSNCETTLSTIINNTMDADEPLIFEKILDLIRAKAREENCVAPSSEEVEAQVNYATSALNESSPSIFTYFKMEIRKNYYLTKTFFIKPILCFIAGDFFT